MDELYNALKADLLRIARDMAQKGAGYGQESVVLREADKEWGPRLKDADRKWDKLLKRQQLILTAWNDLFRERKLSWGYDIDNPNAPFFHVTEEEAREDVATSTTR
ncbi:MAG TPA: hypothetical protein VHD36_05690 [Pirellulales bacterium]|nr:hypothetical protein [Pirellulales bacterium]